MQLSFGSLEMKKRVRMKSTLIKAWRLINWEELRKELTGLYKRELS